MDSRIAEISKYLLTRKTAAEFDPRALPGVLLKHIYILNVERAATKTGLQFRVHFSGTAIDHRFDRSVKGALLESHTHGPHNLGVLSGYERCAKSRAPVWMKQVVRISPVSANFVEACAHYLHPDRIYGGLISGRVVGNGHNDPVFADSFEVVDLARTCSA